MAKNKFGKVMADMGMGALDTLSYTQPWIAGMTGMDPSSMLGYEYQTQTGKQFDKASNTASQVVGMAGQTALPMAANAIAPGSGAAVAPMVGMAQSGMSNYRGPQDTYLPQFAKIGGQVNKSMIEVEGNELEVTPDGKVVNDFSKMAKHKDGGVVYGATTGNHIISSKNKDKFSQGDSITKSSIMLSQSRNQAQGDALMDQFANGGKITPFVKWATKNGMTKSEANKYAKGGIVKYGKGGGIGDEDPYQEGAPYTNRSMMEAPVNYGLYDNPDYKYSRNPRTGVMVPGNYTDFMIKTQGYNIPYLSNPSYRTAMANVTGIRPLKEGISFSEPIIGEDNPNDLAALNKPTIKFSPVDDSVEGDATLLRGNAGMNNQSVTTPISANDMYNTQRINPYVPSNQSLVNTPTISATNRPLNNISNPLMSMMDDTDPGVPAVYTKRMQAEANKKKLENTNKGFDYNSIIPYLGPAFQLGQTFTKKQYVPRAQNPYAGKAMGLMSNRTYDINPALADVKEASRVANYNNRQLANNAGSYLAGNTANVNARNKATSALWAQKNNMDNTYRGEEAQFLANLGAQEAAYENAYQTGKVMTDANVRNMRSQGVMDASNIYMNQQREKNLSTMQNNTIDMFPQIFKALAKDPEAMAALSKYYNKK